ncbi:MAG: acyl carrier protein [Eubacteriales bacterium]|nr:acyl carrier protein [Eubacteriales bacterium]
MVLDKIKEMLSEKTGSDTAEINGDSMFAEMGLDSLDIAELLLGIEEAFGVSVQASPDIIMVNDLVVKVEAALAEKK